MTTTATAPSTRTAARTGRYVRAGLVATVAAAAATSAVAGVGHAAGISLDVQGTPIPVAGFAQLTAIAALLGLALAAVLVRTARSARRTFVRATVTLTALSLVPDVIVSAGIGTKALLMTTHLVAAAIVIPAIARRLPR